ncbi:MAG TPA: type II toxin-antitoxin system PemK/MazF family toxin [Candidatus Saccharimonadales bacterium]|jgi:mRNA interferase MazF
MVAKNAARKLKRGELWWAELGDPSGSAPSFKRPVLVVQADAFNASKISMVVVIALTSNMRLAEAPGNVSLLKSKSGLTKDSVASVSQIITIDKTSLQESIGSIDKRVMAQIDDGLRLVLDV